LTITEIGGVGVVLKTTGNDLRNRLTSEKNLRGIAPDGPDHLIARKNGWKQRRDNAEAPRGPLTENLTLRQRMERRSRCEP